MTSVEFGIIVTIMFLGAGLLIFRDHYLEREAKRKIEEAEIERAAKRRLDEMMRDWNHEDR